MIDPDEKPQSAKGWNWRFVLRNLHRDAGFFVVGLTFLYALSGLAVNHVGDWDPSFSHYKKLYSIDEPLPQDENAAVAEVLSELAIDVQPLDVVTISDTVVRYEISLANRTVRVFPDKNEVTVQHEGSEDREVFELGESLPDDDWEAALTALARLGIDEEPSKVERITIPVRDIDIIFESRTLRVQDYKEGYDVFEEGQSPRFFLRIANWLHLNRGKKGWTYIADAYAIILLFLATSGMLMVRGRKGVIGRGGIFLLAGIAVPVIYLLVTGGP